MVKIIKEKCIGCGICATLCPDGFEIVDGKSKIKNEKANCIERAAHSCPVGAIAINDKNADNFTRPEEFSQRRGFGRRRRGGIGRWKSGW